MAATGTKGFPKAFRVGIFVCLHGLGPHDPAVILLCLRITNKGSPSGGDALGWHGMCGSMDSTGFSSFG